MRRFLHLTACMQHARPENGNMAKGSSPLLENASSLVPSVVPSVTYITPAHAGGGRALSMQMRPPLICKIQRTATRSRAKTRPAHGAKQDAHERVTIGEYPPILWARPIRVVFPKAPTQWSP